MTIEAAPTIPASMLKRTTFKTSRLAEFCSTKELINQTGHQVEDWPLVLLKELVDNAIDACEETGFPPVINVAVADNSISISDNGHGLPPDTIEGILDYTVRVSSREAYVSPTRGAQGNALKTVLAMPFALDGENGETTIEAHGVLHRIVFSIDRIRREPKITPTREASAVRTGTRITVRWPDSACSKLTAAKLRFLQIAENFTWINPHLTLSLDWNRTTENGDPLKGSLVASDLGWTKWRPSDPTSPHWYGATHLERLMAAYIADEQESGAAPPRTVREFISEFRGLSGSAKQKAVLDAVAASRASLAGFFGSGDHVNSDAVIRLLAAMHVHSRPVKPKDLGAIGEDRLRAKFKASGAALESFNYKKAETIDGGLPYLIEFAFGYCPKGKNARRFISGVNWSVSVGSNPFRNLDTAGMSLDSILTQQRAGPNEPIVMVLHLACPRMEYLDRGKSSIVVPGKIAVAIKDLVWSATKRWSDQRRREERHAIAESNRYDRLVAFRERKTTIKGVAYDVMPRAYRDASQDPSTGRTLPANARQIYYAARGEILARTGKDNLDSDYFCQTLLVEYVKETGVDWDIVWDDRGHFTEPHTEDTFGLGTLNVRKYLAAIGAPSFRDPELTGGRVATCGPDGRFGSVLFIEKEGFKPLFESVRLAERHDIAIMSTKGMSVTAARILVDKMCGRYKIPVYVLHDFDVSGFSIFGTLRGNTDRYTFKNVIKVIDLGLRLTDINELGLQSESVSLGKTDHGKIRRRLQRNGATDAEIEFLLSGKRVELNAMTSSQLVTFVERKLAEHGVKKIVPDKACLDKAYRLAVRSERLRKVVEDVIKASAEDDITVPDDLAMRVQDRLSNREHLSWSVVVATIAKKDTASGRDEEAPG
jgi:DNA topoisomerase VI subunit B